ncbi:MAG: heat-inducible transcription repressor HrcA [Rhodothermales bacterium]|nr:heat-inducible transcription repressor HrcA [Rhodothermales bacterium]
MNNERPSANRFHGPSLSARQRSVLRLVVKSFIESADPVGSRSLTERFDLGWSPATIRNTMSELEAMGYLDHPYTSAGRVPTELGYRAFVDELMEAEALTRDERKLLEQHVAEAQADTQALLRESSRLLARLGRLLGVVLSPSMSNGVLSRLEIVPLASDRAMFVLSVEGGLIRTIVLHVELPLKRDRLDRLVAHMNERLAGLTLDEIRRTCIPRLEDLDDGDSTLIETIIERRADLFSDAPESRIVQLEGATFMLSQPEFSEPDTVRELVQLIDDERSVVRLVEDEDTVTLTTPGSVRIRIGHRLSTDSNASESGCRLSVVTAPYTRSSLEGTIGLIGPTRMNYSRAVALVQGVARLISAPSNVA